MTRSETASAKAGPDRPRIAVTLGDPRGIGPEVAARAVAAPEPLDADILLVGPEGLLEIEDVSGTELLAVGRWEGGGGDAAAGRLVVAAIERAVRLALDGDVDGIVTAPIAKPALAAAGYAWPGHTEMLRDLTGVPRTVLCLAAERPTGDAAALRVALVTGHVALRDVPGAFTIERLESVARISHEGLRRWWGIDDPRLAVCALNPHASDGGLFGDEEERICRPAIERLTGDGLAVEGPFPADTVFVRALRGDWDAVLAPYHDVGMAAIKTAAFGRAVNVTLGLPFPRTSPDHGTAFDIAGTGRADPSSMRAALELALRFAARSLTVRAGRDRLTGE